LVFLLLSRERRTLNQEYTSRTLHVHNFIGFLLLNLDSTVVHLFIFYNIHFHLNKSCFEPKYKNLQFYNKTNPKYQTNKNYVLVVRKKTAKQKNSKAYMKIHPHYGKSG
jgi:hypothetical protein